LLSAERPIKGSPSRHYSWVQPRNSWFQVVLANQGMKLTIFTAIQQVVLLFMSSRRLAIFWSHRSAIEPGNNQCPFNLPEE